MQQFIKKHGQLLTLIFVAMIWFAIGWVARSQIQPTETALVEQLRKVILGVSAVSDVDSMTLSYKAARGMVAAMGDEHAGFLEPGFAERAKADFAGDAGQVGVFPELKDGHWVVSVVLDGMPAKEAGILPGDVLVSVDGYPITAETTGIELTLILRGVAGDTADFVVLRDGEEMTFAVPRIERPAVSEPEMLPGEIGYFAQYNFTTKTAELVPNVLNQLMAQGAKVIIWDLRSNGGGSMAAAAQILDEFLDEGVMYQVEFRDGRRQTFAAREGGVATAVPVIILVSERTYSSAETSSIAMREHGRAVLIGTTTHGKGTIQDTIPLPGGTAVQLTVAKWLSPSGVWVNGVGIDPDIVVTDDAATAVDEVLETAVQYAQEHYLQN